MESTKTYAPNVLPIQDKLVSLVVVDRIQDEQKILPCVYLHRYREIAPCDGSFFLGWFEINPEETGNAKENIYYYKEGWYEYELINKENNDIKIRPIEKNLQPLIWWYR